MKYLVNLQTDLCQIHVEDVFGASHDKSEGQGQKVKVTRDKKCHFFGPFGGLRAVCLVKHFSL